MTFRRTRPQAISGFAAFLALVATALPAAATQPLQQFLDSAGRTAFDVRIAEATTEQRVAESDQAWGKLLPSVSARGVYTRNQREVAPLFGGNRIVITPLNQLDAFFQLDVPLIDVANWYRRDAAEAQVEVARKQLTLTQTDVSRSVVSAYYRFLGASALLDASRRSLDAASANAAFVDARRAAGAATDLDYERAASNVEAARQAVADSELTVALSARSLETLSGLSPEAAVQAPEDDLHADGVLDMWQRASENAPAVVLANKTSQAIESNRKAARAALYPTLAASVSERLTNASGFAGNWATYTATVTLAWKLDYPTYVGQRIQDSALAVQALRIDQTKRTIADTVFEAYQRVQAGIARCRAARAQVQSTNRAATLAQDRFAIGAATQLDVTQAQREAFQANASAIQADADLKAARANLRLASGLAVDYRSTP